MSLQGTIKKLEEQVAALTEERDALVAKAEQVAEEHDGQVALVNSQVAEAQETSKAMLAEIADLKNQLEATTDGHEDIINDYAEKIEALTEERDQARAALMNPAVTDAMARGEDNAVELTSIDGDDVSEGEQLLDEFDSIVEPSKRTEFWREHKAELIKARNERREQAQG